MCNPLTLDTSSSRLHAIAVPRGSSFADPICYLYSMLVFRMPSCLVSCGRLIACRDGVTSCLWCFLVFCCFNMWCPRVQCGAGLCQSLIFAFFFTMKNKLFVYSICRQVKTFISLQILIDASVFLFYIVRHSTMGVPFPCFV